MPITEKAHDPCFRLAHNAVNTMPDIIIILSVTRGLSLDTESQILLDQSSVITKGYKFVMWLEGEISVQWLH